VATKLVKVRKCYGILNANIAKPMLAEASSTTMNGKLCDNHDIDILGVDAGPVQELKHCA
jgi:hypothetical protein